MSNVSDWSQQTRQLIAAAIDEDLGQAGDITAALLPEPERQVEARVVSRAAGVVAGLSLAPLICESFTRRLGQTVTVTPVPASDRTGDVADGDRVAAGQPVAALCGPLAAVLTAERTLLNFLGRLSGVATLTDRYVTAARAGNPAVRVLDTRKTLPGWRELDKYAVRAGGGHNHRVGLFDAVLVKDNHLAGIPPERLAEELPRLLARIGGSVRPKFVEVEVDNLPQFEAVCRVPGIDIVLLDNFSLGELRTANKVRQDLRIADRLALEASGGVTLATIADIAATGVDRISVGALTHSTQSLDIGLDL
ncbi:MAG: carboxylating nicotinate-nucleotide diphosphorylase [Phycisphaerae bacterium]|nr:carboxylating nicotinate-nucleotide diphosphorylase [Phycisphaerae bacterium]